jgi:hypothetical protein
MCGAFAAGVRNRCWMLALEKGSGRYEAQLLSEIKKSRILKNLTRLTLG